MKKIASFITNNPLTITIITFVVFYFLPFKPKPFGDGEYHEGTIQLIEYIINGFNGTIRVDKGMLVLFYYLIPYCVVYQFHDPQIYFYAGIIFNLITILFSVYYIFKIFELLNFLDKSKFFTIILMTLFPIHIYYCMGILAETAAFFAVILFAYHCVLFHQGTKNYKLFALTLIIIIAIRPNFIPFALFFYIYLMFYKTDLKNKLIFIGTFSILAFSLTLFERKTAVANESFKEIIFRNQLLWSRFELRDEPFNWLPQHGTDQFASKDYLNNLKMREKLSQIAQNTNQSKTKVFLNWVINDMVNNPLLVLKQYGLKFFESQTFIISPLIKSNKSIWIKILVHLYINTINYILLVFSILAIFKLHKKQKLQVFFPLLILWLWAYFYVCFFHLEARYLYPIRPVLFILFGYYISDYFTKSEIKKPDNQVSY